MKDIDFSVLDGVKAGDVIVVRFKPEAREELAYVRAMNSAGVLVISDLSYLEAVRLTGDWEGDAGRTQHLPVGENWDREFFEGRMRRIIESLSVQRQD